VQRWVNEQAQEGKAAKTIRRVISEVRGYWSYLQTIQAAPEEAFPFDKLKVENGRKVTRQAFDPLDVVKLRAAALTLDKKRGQELADLIELAMYTGCRIEELCALKLEHVNGEAIKIVDAKTEAGLRDVPIHPKLNATLARLRGERRKGYLLASLTANKYGDRSGAIGTRFGRLKTRLGYGEEHVFHSIRKTVATMLENAGVPENVSADILGHDKPTMTYGLYSGGTSLKVRAEAIGRLRYPAPQKGDVAAKPESLLTATGVIW
jgi:integrase